MAIDGNEHRNDVPASLPGAYGQAALLLVESLIHGLCENATLSARAAAEIAQRAVDVQLVKLIDLAGDEDVMRQAHVLLMSIAASLQIDNRE